MKKHTIKTVYVVHHSHTDIGYTDLQERVSAIQVNYIKTVLEMMKQPNYADFRWNCETLYCVEAFWEQATKEQRILFCKLIADGKIGISGNYLNFTDLLDCSVYKERLCHWQNIFKTYGTTIKTAMAADINGISMGCRDAMLENGIEFLFMNVHCHHGMYPLYQNQTPFFWENTDGKRLLVWNGEHYHLGNVLGIKPNHDASLSMQHEDMLVNAAEQLHANLDNYLDSCESQGYAYDFIITAVSGVFSDNAPPEKEILETIHAYNQRYSNCVQLKMVSLQELYEAISPKLQDAPVYRGDFTDWWASGIGSTPYAVKHYKDAKFRYQLCRRLEPDIAQKYPDHCKIAQDNLMLYAEHTWGHSSTITNPYDSMVLHLDMRKNSYASKAHEAASKILFDIAEERGDLLRYYKNFGTIRVCGVSKTTALQLIEFYVEASALDNAEILTQDGKVLPCQVSSHPRGRMISFLDTIAYGEEREYTYHAVPKQPDTHNTRKCYIGAERVRDIINDYDTVSYQLPYQIENDYFRICYRPEKGITSFVDKQHAQEMIGDEVPFFTPVYECTPLRPSICGAVYEERRRLGRNIRGEHANLFVGTLKEIICEERGPVFTRLRLCYTLPNTLKADVLIKLYEALPRIDFCLELGKTLSQDIENVFLAWNLKRDNGSWYLRKGGSEAFRPGIDQLPGSCMDFYVSDDGAAHIDKTGSVLILSRDVPLLYMGKLEHHPIRLCDQNPKNNTRPMYSWIMNNLWETNFKMDLSGFGQYHYSLWLSDETNPERAMDMLTENAFNPYVLIIQ